MALVGTIGNTISKSVMPSGSVLQVVGGSLDYNYDYNQTMVTGSLLHPGTSITPQYATSKILVQVTWMGEKVYGSSGSVSSTGYYYSQVFRNSTPLSNVSDAVGHQAASQMRQFHFNFYLDSPGTTSTLTYNHKVSNVYGGGDVRFIIYYSKMILMEIAG